MNHQVLYVFAVAIGLAGPLEAEPRFVTVDYTGPQSTALVAINANGQIAGLSPGSPQFGARQSSFLADTSGRIGPSFQYAGTVLGTFASGIDNAGNVVGTFDTRPTQSNVFVRSPDGILTLLPLPAGVASAGRAVISGNGSIALSSNQSIFFRAADGTYVAVSVPGAINVSVNGIDNAGNVVGRYYTASGGTSFYRDVHGNVQPISVNGSVYTDVEGMNNLGQAVGSYYDGTRNHGFIWRGGSDFTTLDYPGALSTFASGINDSGIVVGFYDDPQARHGMIYFPTGGTAPTATPGPPTILLALTGIVGLLGHQLWCRKSSKVTGISFFS